MSNEVIFQKTFCLGCGVELSKNPFHHTVYEAYTTRPLDRYFIRFCYNCQDKMNAQIPLSKKL